MSGFLPQGLENYKKSIRKEMGEVESDLIEQLKGASSDSEKTRICNLIGAKKMFFKEKIKKAIESFF